MSSSNCCFLTCIQISQEAGQVVLYSHLFKNFPQFVVIHTVKGSDIVNKADIDVFLELPDFFCVPVDVGNLISGSSAFSKSSLYTWKFSVHILLKSSLEDLSITLLACEMSAIVCSFEYSLSFPFFEIWMKTDLFQSCGRCWLSSQEKLQQDDRRGAIVFKIRPHTCQSHSECANKTLCTPKPRERSSDLHNKLSWTCLWVSFVEA